MPQKVKCQTLDDLLKLVKDSLPGDPVPNVGIAALPVADQAAAKAILELMRSRHQLYLDNRQKQIMLLSDADALGDTLVQIGMGDFTQSIAEVQLNGLKPVRIGIEDMQQQLGKAHQERDHLIQKLQKSEDKFRQLVETTSDWIWEIDADFKYVYSSPQVELLLGHRPQHFIGRTPFELMPGKEAKKVRNAFEQARKTGAATVELKHTSQHKLGHNVVLETKAMPFYSEAGMLLGYRGVDRDITIRSRMEDKLRHMARHDALTGLYNRQVFSELLEYETNRASRYDRPLSALLLDIDYFKKVNDNYGHSAGDDVLKGFAELLLESLRSTDYIARFGGEEFTVLMPETNQEMALKRAQELRAAIEQHPFSLRDGNTLRITSCIGVATFPENANDMESLIKAADEAMYEAKKSGRNRVFAASI